ncbi:oxidoreductase, partial [Paeniclostridium sordellii]|nr:oxidoreductase [Paeniclostridium sordellii]
RASLLPGLFNKICTPIVMLLPHGLVRWIMRTTKLVKLDR